MYVYTHRNSLGKRFSLMGKKSKTDKMFVCLYGYKCVFGDYDRADLWSLTGSKSFAPRRTVYRAVDRFGEKQKEGLEKLGDSFRTTFRSFFFRPVSGEGLKCKGTRWDLRDTTFSVVIRARYTGAESKRFLRNQRG